MIAKTHVIASRTFITIFSRKFTSVEQMCPIAIIIFANMNYGNPNPYNTGGYGYGYSNGPYQDPYYQECNRPYQPGPAYDNYYGRGGYGGAESCLACLAGLCCGWCLLETCCW